MTSRRKRTAIAFGVRTRPGPRPPWPAAPGPWHRPAAAAGPGDAAFLRPRSRPGGHRYPSSSGEAPREHRGTSPELTRDPRILCADQPSVDAVEISDLPLNDSHPAPPVRLIDQTPADRECCPDATTPPTRLFTIQGSDRIYTLDCEQAPCPPACPCRTLGPRVIAARRCVAKATWISEIGVFRGHEETNFSRLVCASRSCSIWRSNTCLLRATPSV